MSDPKQFEAVAAEPKVETPTKELRDFVKKSQLITVTPVDTVKPATVAEPDWYVIGGSDYVFICK